MTQKICFLTVICIYLLTPIGSFVSAESVEDCINDDADCPELDDNSETDKAPVNDNDNSDTDTTATGQSNGSLIWNLVKMAGALLFIVALIYGLLYLLSKRNKRFSKVKALENMGGISVGQNKSMQIVRIGEHFYVVGVGDNVELLHEITDESIIKEFKSEEDHQNQVSFSQFMPKFKQNHKRKQSHSFKSLFAKELEQMKQNRKQLIDKHKDDHYE